jgi:hypothetical protein
MVAVAGAMGYEELLEVAALLLQNGADVNAKGNVRSR